MIKNLEILLGGIAAILGIIATSKWKELKMFGRTGILIAIAALVVGSINAYNVNKKAELVERVDEKIGNLNDIDGATYPAIQFGENGIKFMGFYGAFAFDTDKSLMKAYVKNGQLYVSFIIRNGKELVGSINENEWEMVNPDYDYNYDNTGLEVVTKGDRRVLFQIYLKNGIAHFLGMYSDSEGKGMYLFPNKTDSLYNIQGVTIGPDKEFKIPADKITPLFKYPRRTHLGERAK